MAGSMHPFTGKSGNTLVPGLRIQYGTADVAVNDNYFGEHLVVYDEPFTSAPTVVCSWSANNQYWIVGTTGGTATQVALRAFERSRTNRNATIAVSWIAIGI